MMNKVYLLGIIFCVCAFAPSCKEQTKEAIREVEAEKEEKRKEDYEKLRKLEAESKKQREEARKELNEKMDALRKKRHNQ